MDRREFFDIFKIDMNSDPTFETMEIPSTERIQEEVLEDDGLPEDVRLVTDALLWVCTHYDFATADKIIRGMADNAGDFFVKCIRSSRKFTKTFTVHFKSEWRNNDPLMVVENEEDYIFPKTTDPYNPGYKSGG